MGVRWPTVRTEFFRRQVSVPYWLAAASLVGVLVGSSLGSWVLLDRPKVVPAAYAQVEQFEFARPELSDAVLETAVDALSQQDIASSVLQVPDIHLEARLEEAGASAAKLPGLQSQLAELLADYEQAQRENDLVRDQARRQSEDLTSAQTELAATEDQIKVDLGSLHERIGTLEEQVRTTEQLAREMRDLLGMTSSAALDSFQGGPTLQDLESAADPWEVARSAIESVESRISVLQVELEAVNAEAQVQAEARAREEAEAAAQARAVAEAEAQAVRDRDAAASVEVASRNDVAYSASSPIGPPVNGPITSYFGTRVSPFADGSVGEFHTGLDIAVPEGTPVRVTGGGTVRLAGWYGGYGMLVIVDHGQGVSTWYGHNSTLYVVPGQQIARGHVIAGAGTTGRSTGPHVHYEIRVNENPIDPIQSYRQ